MNSVETIRPESMCLDMLPWLIFHVIPVTISFPVQLSIITDPSNAVLFRGPCRICPVITSLFCNVRLQYPGC